MKRSFLTLTLSITLLLSGCHSTNIENKDTLRIAISHDPLSLDPRYATLSKDISITQALYEGLVREKDHSPQLALVDHYTITNHNTTYTFYLKPSKWSNGDPLTAYDFEASLKQLHTLETATPSTPLLHIIKHSQAVMHKQLPLEQLGIKAHDDLTLEITLEQPLPHLLEILAHPIFFPIHHSLRNRDSQKDLGQMITNGPFILDAYHPQDHLIIRKNPYYHDKESVSLKTIVFQIIPDIRTAILLLKKNEIDWMGSPWSSPITKEDLKYLPEENIHHYPVLNSTVLLYNLNHPSLHNKSLRKALHYAIDKETLLNFIAFGHVAHHFLPPQLSTLPQSHETKIEREAIARAYFQQAKAELPEEQIAQLSIIYPLESPLLNAIVQEIQQQIKKVLGISLPIQGMEYHCFVDKRNRGEFTLATGRWIADYPRPSSFLSALSQTHTKNNPTPNMTEEHIEEETLIIPLYHFDYVYALQPHIQRLYTSTLGHVDLKEAIISK